MKNTLAAIVAAPIIMYSAANAQVEDYLRKKPQRDVMDMVDDKVERTVQDADDLWTNIRDFGNDAWDWVSDFYLEKKLEYQIEKDISYVLSDKEARDYLSDNYPPAEVDADVLKFIETDSTFQAIAELSYDLHFDDSKIIRQYLINIDDGKVDNIAETGKTYVMRHGHEITVPELVSLIKLNKSVNDRWGEIKTQYDMESEKTLKYELSNEAFKGIKSFLEDRYKSTSESIMIPDDMTTAKVGIVCKESDVFGNAKDDAMLHIVELYRNTSEGWKYENEIYRAKWSKEALLGTEVNKFQEKSTIEKIVKSVKDAMKDIIDVVN